MPISQFDERVVYISPTSYAAGTGVSILSVAQGTGYGTRVDQFLLSWLGAAPFEVDIRLNDGFGDVSIIGTVTLPAATGTVYEQVDVLAALMPAGQQFIQMNAGGSIEVITKAAITGSQVLNAYAAGGQF
jgi:hypothetical protein